MSTREWKRKNYNRNVKVSESVIAQIRKGTKESNIRKANAPGASAQFKEGVRRFYGKNTVKDTASVSAAKPAAKKVATKASVSRTRATAIASRASGDKSARAAAISNIAGGKGKPGLPPRGKPSMPSNSSSMKDKPKGGGPISAAAKAVVGTAGAAALANRARSRVALERTIRADAKSAASQAAKKSAVRSDAASLRSYTARANAAQRAFDKGLITKVELQEVVDQSAMAKRAIAAAKSRAAQQVSTPRAGAANKMRAQGARILSGRSIGDRSKRNRGA